MCGLLATHRESISTVLVTWDVHFILRFLTIKLRKGAPNRLIESSSKDGDVWSPVVGTGTYRVQQ